MLIPLQRRLSHWLSNRIQPRHQPICLDRRHIYILPTLYGYVFASMLFVMFLWAINYSNSMGFILTFLLSAVALNTMWRSHNTLLKLWLRSEGATPVFAGQEAGFSFRLLNPDARPRYGIGLSLENNPDACEYADIPANGEATVTLKLAAAQRGLLPAGRLRLFTCVPLGLFQAWSWQEFEQVCLVYPRPEGAAPLPQRTAISAGGDGGEHHSGSEDYTGLRDYVPGDSPRHVAWKASARSSDLLVKRFTDQTRAELWLDWRLLAPRPVETRLSQLCQWVLKGEAEGHDYGLRLPGIEYPPARGESHRRRCLEALALYDPMHGEQR
ncbi:MAG: DUF58 domain-containing protein [Candidatus Competibacteraceae bacterium]